MATLYAAITNHGFGHATRMAAVLSAIQAKCPEISLIVATSAPRWLLAEYLSGDFFYHDRAFDVGVVQSDSLTMDKKATLNKWQTLQQQQQQIIDQEANFLRQQQVKLVLADIPHLAVEIAHKAGVPCWMISNFGWDFIYRQWGSEFQAISEWLSSSYQRCDRLFRLPFHESMSSFRHLEDVGLTGAQPHFSSDFLYQKLALDPQISKILLTFGGLNLEAIPYQNVKLFPDYQFLTFDQNAPNLPNLKVIDRHTKVRPIDVIQICDRIITKPGYGTLSEIYRSHKPVICLTRQDFAEADVLLAGVRDYMAHLIIDPDEFYDSAWQFLTAPTHPPQTNRKLATDGEQTIAKSVLAYLTNGNS